MAPGLSIVAVRAAGHYSCAHGMSDEGMLLLKLKCVSPPDRGLGKTARRQRGRHRHARPPPPPWPYPQMRAAELEDQVASGTMSTERKTGRKAT